MASSIPAALDYFVAAVRALPEAQAPVVVSDGFPVTRSTDEIIIGIDDEDGDSEVTGSYAELSSQEYEDVEVPCQVAVRRSGSNAPSACRAAAFVLFDAIRALVAADRRFGGAIRTGMPARVARWTMSQTSTATQAGEGRVCSITFVISWQHRG